MTGRPQLLAILAALCVLASGPAFAESYDQWLQGFGQRAQRQGITTETLTMAFEGVRPSQKVIELDGKQPEKKIGFDEYYKRTVTADRVAKGQRYLRDNWQLLSRIEKQSGVQAQYVIALWGIETSYGTNTGGFDLIQALSTLAWEGRRGQYFESELVKALKILQGGHVRRSEFKGSWAGAMGQIQFMPSSWFAYALDYDGDGHKDIWSTRADVYASAANYLTRSGWSEGQRWGRQVTLAPNFNTSYINSNAKFGLAEWAKMGVRDIPPGEPNMKATLIRPDGAGGKTYLVYNNFQTIMSWNRSKYFALSVGMLADKIAQTRPGGPQGEILNN